MRTLIAVLIGIVLFSVATSNPERSRIPTVSADTLMLAEVRSASEAVAPELVDSPDTLVVERPVDAREGATAGVFIVAEDVAVLWRVEVGYGRASPSMIQILSGASAGDRIVVSNMRAWDAFDRLRLK
jgi:hypothetical protein